MNNLTSTHHPVPVITDPSASHFFRHGADPELKQLLSSTFSILEQSPPPTLRDILGAYRTNGDGDRDMLLAMLNAKTAEDQRLASVAALQRSVLEAYQAAPALNSHPPPARMSGSRHYPTPSFTQSPSICPQKPRRAHHHQHHAPSDSQSPPRVDDTYGHLPSMRLSHPEPSRKRHRPSRSPPLSHVAPYESYPGGSQHEQLPPSPYSSSGSDSAEYSPRSRASMAIGSLLSSGPTKEAKVDDS